jgi:hypothetical protein
MLLRLAGPAVGQRRQAKGEKEVRRRFLRSPRVNSASSLSPLENLWRHSRKIGPAVVRCRMSSVATAEASISIFGPDASSRGPATQRLLAASRAFIVCRSGSSFSSFQRGPPHAPRCDHLQLVQERHQLFLLLTGQPRFQDQVEEFDCIEQGQQPPVVEVRG